MTRYRMWATGNSLAAPESPGPGAFVNLPNTNWTDLLGFHQGYGVTYRGKKSQNWFHCPIPSASQLDGKQVSITAAYALFATGANVLVREVTLWDGPKLIHPFRPLGLNGNFSAGIKPQNTFTLPAARPFTFGIGLSMLVDFVNEDTFFFAGAGIELDV